MVTQFRQSPNFAFLAHHDPRLVALGTQAEDHFETDPSVTLFKLRQFGEVLAKRAAAKVGLYIGDEGQQALIDRLADRGVIGPTQRTLFHDLRRVGNAAVHEGAGDHSEALHQLRMARELAIWFQRSFGNNRKFEPGPFVPPPDPKKPDPTLHAELERLRGDVAARHSEIEAAQRALEELRKAAEAEASKRLTAEERARKAQEEAAIWETLAHEQTTAGETTTKAELAALAEQNKKLQSELAALQAAAQAMPPAQLEKTIEAANNASAAIELDEAATRKLIDRQLRDAGWEVDTERLTYNRGVRPQKGKNLAIAEWPTLTDGVDGRADYVLFAGRMVVGVVEAKKKHKDVAGVIQQAKRYSCGYVVQGGEQLPEGSPWGKYRVPFLFATNGRPFLRQLLTKSGIWFLDARRKANHPVPLEGWYTPEGLVDLLRQNIDEAHEKLEVEPMPYIERDYQRNAILATERAIQEGKREALLAMATGTGKTRTCIGLCYRLLKTRRFRRVLFLVDRNALGRQTADAFKDLRLEELQTFTDIFDVKELGDLKPERDTRLQIATVQAMVRRVLGGDGSDVPPVDQYDCIVVDECHRGYLLDRELSDHEFEFRSEEDYISKYRRVLDHFDAVKIGLTATPALHTTEIFGPPIFNYSYREAVVDGYLVDHEPPIRIVTKLAKDGIHYQAREEVLVLERTTQTLKKERLRDDVDFEVDAFNKRVITENFNRAVLGEVVKHIDPAQSEKTLVFCATDEHADLAVSLLKQALTAQYGEVDDDAVMKITGASDKPLELIRRFRNERMPNIVVTVDLLTTGVDVPSISNLVFLRRVRSRILYEQMIGRATRLCPDIGKERFRIFDAVDLYAAIKDVTDMKPVVVNPHVTFEQLAVEIIKAKEMAERRGSLSELVAKLQRKKRACGGNEQLETAAGMSYLELLRFLRNAKPDAAATWLAKHGDAIRLLDRVTGGAYKIVVSQHADHVREVSRGYGANKRPEDYLDSFGSYIKANGNAIPAILVVTQRPRDLTREDLRKLKLALDTAGFTEQALQTAWRESKNEDFAATIIGYIRQQALGSPLRPYRERVDHAVQRLLKANAFTAPQRKWLERIAEQIKVETVVDRGALDRGQFKAEGGFARLNKVFEGKLATILGELADEVWRDAG